MWTSLFSLVRLFSVYVCVLHFDRKNSCGKNFIPRVSRNNKQLILQKRKQFICFPLENYWFPLTTFEFKRQFLDLFIILSFVWVFWVVSRRERCFKGSEVENKNWRNIKRIKSDRLIRWVNFNFFFLQILFCGWSFYNISEKGKDCYCCFQIGEWTDLLRP